MLTRSGVRQVTRERAIKRYWREISAVLVLKVVAIGVLYALFFAPADRPIITAETVAAHFQQNGGQK
jgi:membrane-anchored protein YejM (alkaline phosphatase superfamily)